MLGGLAMNKRRFTRVEFAIGAVIEFDGEAFEGRVENISLRGIFIRTDRRVPLGTYVDITINLYSLEPDRGVMLHARSARVDDEGVGFEFHAMDSDSFAHLYGIVSYVSGDHDAVLDEFAGFAQQNIRTI
jgi:PilZ domain